MLTYVWTTFQEQPRRHQKQSDAPDRGTHDRQNAGPYSCEYATDFLPVGPRGHLVLLTFLSVDLIQQMTTGFAVAAPLQEHGIDLKRLVSQPCTQITQRETNTCSLQTTKPCPAPSYLISGQIITQ